LVYLRRLGLLHAKGIKSVFAASDSARSGVDLGSEVVFHEAERPLRTLELRKRL